MQSLVSILLGVTLKGPRGSKKGDFLWSPKGPHFCVRMRRKRSPFFVPSKKWGSPKGPQHSEKTVTKGPQKGPQKVTDSRKKTACQGPHHSLVLGLQHFFSPKLRHCFVEKKQRDKNFLGTFCTHNFRRILGARRTKEHAFVGTFWGPFWGPLHEQLGTFWGPFRGPFFRTAQSFCLSGFSGSLKLGTFWGPQKVTFFFEKGPLRVTSR